MLAIMGASGAGKSTLLDAWLCKSAAGTNRYSEIMENKMETTIVFWGYIGIMENKMEATIVTG